MEPIRIELAIGWSMGSVNAYLFTHPEVILVDGLAVHGVAVGDISRIVVTHPHVDHFGLAGRIVTESDAMVWISELGAPWLTDMLAMWAARMAYYRRDLLPPVGLPPETNETILRGMEGLAAAADPVPAERVVAFQPDGLLQMGGLGWQVIHTPGHAAAQTVFYQPETRQLLIDHPAPGERRTPALPLFLRSLAAMEALAVDTVHPGHGRPFGDHHEVIARQRERIIGRQARCLDLISSGQTTIPELLDSMYTHQPPESRVAGLWMLLGYLDLLLADGAIVEEVIGGVNHYRIA